MKTFLLLPLLTIVQLISVFAEAYVLPLDIILHKTAGLAGSSIIAVEQNVIFKDAGKEFIVKEEWLIEGDKNLRLTATGVGELKDLIKIRYLYNNKKRTQIIGKNKSISEISPEFFEKFLAIKSVESYHTYLKDLGISPKVRLSRARGAISFAVGEPSNGKALSPQIWIDQDYFRLNKIRFPSESEVEFSDFKDYGNVHYPNLKIVVWADKNAALQVTKVSTKTGATIKSFYPEALDMPSEIYLANKGPLGLKVEEFYKRFR